MAKSSVGEEVGWTRNAGLVDVHMHRVAYLATAAVFAAVPVSIGLIGNTSFSEHVQVRVPPPATVLDANVAAPRHRAGPDPHAGAARRNPEAAPAKRSTDTHRHHDAAPAAASGANSARGADRDEPVATAHSDGSGGDSQVVTTDDHERAEVRSTSQGPGGGDDAGTEPIVRSGSSPGIGSGSGSDGGSGGSPGSGPGVSSGGSSGSGSGGHSGSGSSSGSGGSGSGGSGSGGSGSGSGRSGSGSG